MRYFARRCGEPQVVADLTSETFVRAAGAFGGFDPARGSARRRGNPRRREGLFSGVSSSREGRCSSRPW